MPSAAADRFSFPARWPASLRSAPGLLTLLALWLLCTAWMRPLLLPDEGRYADVAREMLLGNRLVPTLDGLPFFHKPPLMYWLDIAAMQVFGVNPFAARAAPLVGAWLMAATLFFGLRRWHGERVAVIGLGVIATCPFFFAGAQYANHDMLVAGLISAAVIAFIRAVDEPPRVALGWLVVAWVGCALALLAKGLIGIVLPALVVGGWLLAQRRWRQTVALLHPLALLAFLLVGAPWFVAMQWQYPAFFDYFFIEQHFRRYAESGFNNVQPLWFFVLVLPVLTLPWSLWLPASLRRAWALRNGFDAALRLVGARGGRLLHAAGIEAGRLRAAGGRALVRADRPRSGTEHGRRAPMALADGRLGAAVRRHHRRAGLGRAAFEPPRRAGAGRTHRAG